MLCSKLSMLCKLLSLSSSKTFLPLQKATLYPLNSHSPFHPASSPWQPLVCFLSLWILNYFYVCLFCDAFERTLDKKSGEWTTHPSCLALSFSYWVFVIGQVILLSLSLSFLLIYVTAFTVTGMPFFFKWYLAQNIYWISVIFNCTLISFSPRMLLSHLSRY